MMDESLKSQMNHQDIAENRGSVSTLETCSNVALTEIRSKMAPRFSVAGIQTTQTDETIIGYLDGFKKLKNQAGREMGIAGNITWREFFDWYLKQNERWAIKTINLYKMSITTGIEARIENDALAKDLLHLTKRGPKPRPAKQTKALMREYGKRTRLSLADWKAFQAEAHRRGNKFDLFCLAFLHLCLTYAPRPIEWATAQMIDDRLVIQTAKSTNCRTAVCDLSSEAVHIIQNRNPSDRWVVLAGNSFREIDLLWETDNSQTFMAEFLAALQSQIRTSGGWTPFYKKMCERIRRICNRAGLTKSIAPYSTRHIALSAAKAEAGVHVAAALVAHKNTRSTTSNYLKSDARNSLVSPAGKVKVSSNALKAVVVSPREVPPSRQKESTQAQPKDYACADNCPSIDIAELKGRLIDAHRHSEITTGEKDADLRNADQIKRKFRG